ADVGVHAEIGAATAVEVVDAEAEDPEPAAAPEAGVQVERLVVALALGQVVVGLVAGAVGAARLEKQRPELVAGDGVGQPGRRVTVAFPDRSVGSMCLAGCV